ncbi:hypothetical protein AOLI_G00056660 [Acnodon oligacanthus]
MAGVVLKQSCCSSQSISRSSPGLSLRDEQRLSRAALGDLENNKEVGVEITAKRTVCRGGPICYKALLERNEFQLHRF